MLRDITIGQYYSVDSIIHRLDPRIKIIGSIIYIISLFVVGKWQGYLVAAFFLMIMIKLSKVPFKYMVKGLKSIVMIMMITVIFNLFLTKGDALVTLGPLKITLQGVQVAINMAVRLVLLVLGSSLMTYTTTPNALTDGLEKVFAPLKVIKVPVNDMAMMMSIALRFIPILMDETDKIIKAQQARGADFETGSFMKRAKAMVPILIPLFVSAFKRANDLAMAMEARCYRGGDGRTRMRPLKYKKRDYIAWVILITYLIGMIILGQILRSI